MLGPQFLHILDNAAYESVDAHIQLGQPCRQLNGLGCLLQHVLHLNHLVFEMANLALAALLAADECILLAAGMNTCKHRIAWMISISAKVLVLSHH